MIIFPALNAYDWPDVVRTETFYLYLINIKSSTKFQLQFTPPACMTPAMIIWQQFLKNILPVFVEVAGVIQLPPNSSAFKIWLSLMDQSSL